jgi:hypothetical protein
MIKKSLFITYDELYDAIIGDGDGEKLIDDAYFKDKLCELVVAGFIREGENPRDFTTLYIIKEGITRADCRASFTNNCICDTQLSILLQFLENNDAFFIFKNTQSGKSGIMIKELIKWYCEAKYAVIPFLVVSNLIDLAQQTINRIEEVFAEQGKKVAIFNLSSIPKKGTDVEDIKRAIHCWDGNRKHFAMPIIILLNNNAQQKKMLTLIKYIYELVIGDSGNKIRYGVIWDEADQTYALSRNKEFIVDREKVSCKKFMVDNTEALYRLGFASATDGDLLSMDGDKENYPECASAVRYHDDISPEDMAHYRAIHLPEAIIHEVPYTSKDSNNSYAEKVFQNNSEHFETQILLTTGIKCERKIIVNGNTRVVHMEQFAIENSKKGKYVIVYNGAGLKLYKDGVEFYKYTLKKWCFNERLYYIYKSQKLCDKPLIVIGGFKINRGITFHYCPSDNNEKIIKGEHGDVITKNMEGLVFTDIILGYIQDLSTAVQKDGRGSGKIGNSPQYSGETHYWIDKKTADKAITHNKVVDMINRDKGLETMKVIKNRAVEELQNAFPKIPENHNTDEKLYRVYPSVEEMKKAYKEIFNKEYTSKDFDKCKKDEFIKCSIFRRSDVLELCDVIRRIPTAIESGGGGKEGNKVSRNLFWCYKDTSDPLTLHFVIPIDPLKITAEHLAKVDSIHKYVKVPTRGNF